MMQKISILFFNKAISESVKLMNEIVNVYNKIEKYQSSKKILEYALSVKPLEPITLNNLGIVFRKLENYELAICNLTKAIELEQKNDRYITNLAVAVAEW